MHNEDGSVWITFNGEIFNYIELREQLARLGPPLPHQQRHRGHRSLPTSSTARRPGDAQRPVRVRLVGQPATAVLAGAGPPGHSAPALRARSRPGAVRLRGQGALCQRARPASLQRRRPRRRCSPAGRPAPRQPCSRASAACRPGRAICFDEEHRREPSRSTGSADFRRIRSWHRCRWKRRPTPCRRN